MVAAAHEVHVRGALSAKLLIRGRVRRVKPIVFVLGGVDVPEARSFLQVGTALDALSLFARASQAGQENREQQCDDRDDNEQLNQCKRARTMDGVHGTSFPWRGVGYAAKPEQKFR